MVKKKVKVNVCAHDEWTGLLSGFCLKINVPWSWPKSSVCLSVVICFSMGIDDAIPITNKVNQNIATISFDLEQYILERDASTSENLHSDSPVSCVCLSLYQFDLHQSLSNLTDSHLHINHCKRFVSLTIDCYKSIMVFFMFHFLCSTYFRKWNIIFDYFLLSCDTFDTNIMSNEEILKSLNFSLTHTHSHIVKKKFKWFFLFFNVQFAYFY